MEPPKSGKSGKKISTLNLEKNLIETQPSRTNKARYVGGFRLRNHFNTYELPSSSIGEIGSQIIPSDLWNLFCKKRDNWREKNCLV